MNTEILEFHCKMCNGPLQIVDGNTSAGWICQCEYCGKRWLVAFGQFVPDGQERISEMQDGPGLYDEPGVYEVVSGPSWPDDYLYGNCWPYTQAEPEPPKKFHLYLCDDAGNRYRGPAGYTRNQTRDALRAIKKIGHWFDDDAIATLSAEGLVKVKSMSKNWPYDASITRKGRRLLRHLLNA